MNVEGESTDHHNQHDDLHTKETTCTYWFCNGVSPSMARYIYGLIFLATNLLAWMVRDNGRAALSELRRLQGCHGAKDCLGTEGVLRISLGCFIFFFTMFLSTVKTKKLAQGRNSWHSSWWSAKLMLWITSMIVPFYLPSGLVLVYGKIAYVCAGIFLFIQLISVISFITWLNDCCQNEKNADRCRVQVLVISVLAYVLALAGIILMYIWYASKPSCKANIFFITLTLGLIQLTTFVSTLPRVNAGLLTPGLMGVYLVFICWCAIRSEPHTESCNNKIQAAMTHSDCLTIISFVIALLAIVVATFTTGIDSTCFQFRKVKVDAEDDVPYGYGFFHFVFAMGAAYFAMLFIGWNTHHTMRKWTIDVGWVSTWVRVVNEWLTALVYLWVMVAPLIWKKMRCLQQQQQQQQQDLEQN